MVFKKIIKAANLKPIILICSFSLLIAVFIGRIYMAARLYYIGEEKICKITEVIKIYNPKVRQYFYYIHTQELSYPARTRNNEIRECQKGDSLVLLNSFKLRSAIYLGSWKKTYLNILRNYSVNLFGAICFGSAFVIFLIMAVRMNFRQLTSAVNQLIPLTRDKNVIITIFNWVTIGLQITICYLGIFIFLLLLIKGAFLIEQTNEIVVGLMIILTLAHIYFGPVAIISIYKKLKFQKSLTVRIINGLIPIVAGSYFIYGNIMFIIKKDLTSIYNIWDLIKAFFEYLIDF